MFAMSRIWKSPSLLPDSCIFAGGFIIGFLLAIQALAFAPHPQPAATPPFVAAGTVLRSQFSDAYAAAFRVGADALDAGEPLSAAIRRVEETWAAGRQAAFHRLIVPGLERIVPDGTADGDFTMAQRAALSRAWRDLAAGLADDNPSP